MKNIILTQIIILLINAVAHSQNLDCNRAVWIKQDEKKLPEGICIPKGYLISNIYESTDINGDNLNDFIIKWRKPELCDGDTFYLSIYKQNSDSTFSHFRTFSNLYPVYFKSYSADYTPKEERLQNIQKKYNGHYPLIKLAFKNDIIRIEMKEDAEANLVVTYKFDKAINNWRFEKSEEYFLVGGGYKPIDLSEELGPTIDNFTYFIWDNANK